MYEVVEIVQFYLPNAQCMHSSYTFYLVFLVIFSGLGLDLPHLGYVHALS